MLKEINISRRSEDEIKFTVQKQTSVGWQRARVAGARYVFFSPIRTVQGRNSTQF